MNTRFIRRTFVLATFLLSAGSSFAQVDMSRYLGGDDVEARNYSFDYSDADAQRDEEFNPDDIGAQVQLAYNQLQRNAYDSALENIDEALVAFPDYAFAHWVRGVCHMGLDSIDLAKKDFNNCLSHDPLFAQAYTNLGIIDVGEEKYLDAREKFEKALTIDPDYAYPQYLIGNIYLYQENIRKAIKYYDKALDIDPEMFEAHFSKGIIYYYEDKDRKAVESFTKALEKAENPASIYLMRGVSYALTKNVKEAMADWEKGAEYDSTEFRFYIYRTYVMIENNMEEEGIDLMIEGMRNNPSKLNARSGRSKRMLRYQNLQQALFTYDKEKESLPPAVKEKMSKGIALYLQNEFDKSRKQFDEALMFQGGFASAYYFSALCYQRSGNVNGAASEYKHVIEKDPNNFGAYQSLGRIQSSQGKNMESMVNFSQMIRLFPENAIPYVYRGLAWIELEKYQNAYLDFTEAIKRDSSLFEAWEGRGRVLLKFGNYEPAVRDMYHAYNAAPGRVQLLESYGKALMFAGDTSKSLELYSEYLDDHPENKIIRQARADALFLQKDYQQAQVDYTYLINNGYNYYGNYADRILCYYGMELYDKVLSECEEVTKNRYFGDDLFEGQMFYYAGLAYHQKGQADNCCDAFNKAERKGYQIPKEYKEGLCPED